MLGPSLRMQKKLEYPPGSGSSYNIFWLIISAGTNCWNISEISDMSLNIDTYISCI